MQHASRVVPLHFVPACFFYRRANPWPNRGGVQSVGGRDEVGRSYNSQESQERENACCLNVVRCRERARATQGSRNPELGAEPSSDNSKFVSNG